MLTINDTSNQWIDCIIKLNVFIAIVVARDNVALHSLLTLKISLLHGITADISVIITTLIDRGA